MNDYKPKIMVGIPAYNEEKYIAKVILRAKKHADYIVVVNDGSSDMTAEIARALGAEVIEHTKNMGYGAALKTIFKEAKSRDVDILVTIDADDQHNPDEIPRLIKPIVEEGADVTIGSRFLGETKQPAWRKFGIKVINRAFKTLNKGNGDSGNLTDTQSGFRAYNRRAIHNIMPESNGMEASIEILYQAIGKGLRIKEVPITVNYHEDASTHNPVSHGARVIVRIIEIVAERHPLLLLGLPGFISTILGSALIAHSLYSFNKTRVFNPPEVLIATILFFAGLTMTTLATLLYVISKLKRE
ncbi:MAG: glycosyltransferase family 2 protein [Desulfurococcales archaeon]|nr:glycosyltransferase family 2 protein [Desulfurococcales archaeon]